MRQPPAPSPGENPRLALTITDAATSMSMSPRSFRRHVLPDLKVLRIGALVLVSRAEIEAFVARHSRGDL